MDALTLILFVLGLGLLVAGAELLVRGASRLAAAMGITPLVIGLTVVAFGTSSPEMAVSVSSALNGSADIALGNVVGSNIFNVLFILGASAIVTPLVVAQQLVRIDVPIMIGVSVLLVVLAADGQIQPADGLVLFAGIVAYTVFSIWQARREHDKAIEAEYAQEYGEKETRGVGHTVKNIGLIAAGLALLGLGSNWLVNGAVSIAKLLGVSDLIIGLTIVAAGTSLPEVAASIMASLKGERDIAVGNVVGSNIFNILAVLGASASISPTPINVPPSALAFDLPIMLAVAIAALPVFITGYTIARWEGFVFLGYYIAYTLFLILDATDHDALPAFSGIMLLFVAPLTLITLGVGVFRHVRAGRAPRDSLASPRP